MINHFSKIVANDEAIVPVMYRGEEWLKMTTTRWDDMDGQTDVRTLLVRI